MVEGVGIMTNMHIRSGGQRCIVCEGSVSGHTLQTPTYLKRLPQICEDTGILEKEIQGSICISVWVSSFANGSICTQRFSVFKLNLPLYINKDWGFILY